MRRITVSELIKILENYPKTAYVGAFRDHIFINDKIKVDRVEIWTEKELPKI